MIERSEPCGIVLVQYSIQCMTFDGRGFLAIVFMVNSKHNFYTNLSSVFRSYKRFFLSRNVARVTLPGKTYLQNKE